MKRRRRTNTGTPPSTRAFDADFDLLAYAEINKLAYAEINKLAYAEINKFPSFRGRRGMGYLGRAESGRDRLLEMAWFRRAEGDAKVATVSIATNLRICPCKEP